MRTTRRSSYRTSWPDGTAFRKRSSTPYRKPGTTARSRQARPTLLTSLTTFIGLAPLMLEQSFDAMFVVPMAVSLAFGVLFATFITLVLVPTLYLIIEDIRRVARKVFELDPTERGAVEPTTPDIEAAPLS